MINANDVLRSLRYTLDINEAAVVGLLSLTGYEANIQQVSAWLAKEDEASYQICPELALAHFLDGLIIDCRGLPEGKDYQAPNPNIALSNNMILKKLRIAFELQEDEMLETLDAAGLRVSKQELSALFRKEGHHNYRECGDQFLRNFLKGLNVRFRK